MAGAPELSLIIPAYNEVQRIRPTLAAVRAFLDSQDSPYEVLVCADGDDGTRERARELRDPRRSAGRPPPVGASRLAARGDVGLARGARRQPVLLVVKGQDPLHILGEGHQARHYTYGGDLARDIGTAMESPNAVNEDFNLSTAASTTVLDLVEAIWRKVHGPERPFRYVSDPPFEHDVQLRVPDVRKAREVLGFEVTTTLDEVVPWIRTQLEAGRL